MNLVLCDDHRLFLEPLAAAVAAQGHNVAVATHPSDAVRVVESVDPDVCVLDLHFPGGSGLDAARTIRDRFPRTRVMMLTASVDQAAVSASLAMGVSGFVRKDQAVPALLDAIERVRQGEQVLSGCWKAGDRGGVTGSRAAYLRLMRSLTPRERQVLAYLLQAHDTHAIAATLNISESTARTHVQNVLVKLGVHSRLQAVATVTKHGLTLSDLLAMDDVADES